jgi:hypothetical protein
MRATRPVHLILLDLIILDKEYKQKVQTAKEKKIRP